VTYPAVCSKGVTLLGNADRADRKRPCARNRTSGWNVRWPAIRAWGQDHSRILDRRAANTRAAPKAPERPVRCPSIPSRNMTDDDHNLDDLKDQLSRGFGVQVREDLQVRAEIVIQPEEGRWVFTPDELSDLAEGLRSVLLKSKPEGGWPFRLTLKQYVGLFDHAIPDGHSYSE
jgi:hypothetical protein